jgi:hypothetical protein
MEYNHLQGKASHSLPLNSQDVIDVNRIQFHYLIKLLLNFGSIHRTYMENSLLAQLVKF